MDWRLAVGLVLFGALFLVVYVGLQDAAMRSAERDAATAAEGER
jgi:hypothetical protein